MYYISQIIEFFIQKEDSTFSEILNYSNLFHSYTKKCLEKKDNFFSYNELDYLINSNIEFEKRI